MAIECFRVFSSTKVKATMKLHDPLATVRRLVYVSRGDMVYRVTGVDVREALVNERIACLRHAHEFGIDRPDLTEGKWPL